MASVRRLCPESHQRTLQDIYQLDIAYRPTRHRKYVLHARIVLYEPFLWVYLLHHSRPEQLHSCDQLTRATPIVSSDLKSRKRCLASKLH